MVRKVIKGEASPIDPASAHGAALADRKVIDRVVFKAQQRAEEIKRQAESKAALRRQEGATQAEAVYREAYGVGGVSGTEQVAADALLGYRGRVDRLMSSVDDCIAIARQICTKIMGAKLRLDDETVRSIAIEALRVTSARRQATVLMAPERLASLPGRASRLWQEIEQQCFLVATEDAGLPEDQCLIRTDAGDLSVDAGAAETMLREVLQLGAEAEPEARLAPQNEDEAAIETVQFDSDIEAAPASLPESDSADPGAKDVVPVLPDGSKKLADLVARVDAED